MLNHNFEGNWTKEKVQSLSNLNTFDRSLVYSISYQVTRIPSPPQVYLINDVLVLSPGGFFRYQLLPPIWYLKVI